MSLHNIADLVGMEEELTDDEDFIELLNIELRIPRGKSHQKPCGSLLTILGELSGVDKSTTSRLITKTIRAIAGLHSEFIEMRSNAEDVQRLRESFYNISKFPRCIGALDCTHIRIQSPGGQDADRYRNRKDLFSHNVRVVCDSDLLIRNIVCRWHGSTHDSYTIFNNSSLKVKLENEEFGEGSLVVGDSGLKVKLENEEFGEGSLVVGDSGYAVRKYLISPLANPRTPAEHLFNESQIRTRNPVERCFGAWKRRFLALALGIRLHNSKVEAITVAAAVLHNVACMMNDAEGIRLHNSKVEAITVAAAVLHNVACMMNDAEPRVTNDEEAAVCAVNHKY
ncbi:DDE superfamily endonuclease [Popillia japonica]|uniref:DDE superfamily endonuclease n=1 Tax=Popillia japonica TaxID=7064 RepID=A0AAW1IC89_POPJA